MKTNINVLIESLQNNLLQYQKLTSEEKQILIQNLNNSNLNEVINDIWVRSSDSGESIEGIDIKELLDYVNEFFKSHDEYNYKYISPIFQFPYSSTKDYVTFVENEILNHKRNWISGGLNGKGIYNSILRNELIPVDSLMPTEINTRCNGVYVIADEKGKVIYIGKRDAKDSHVIVRFLDHLVPKKSNKYPYGQPSNSDGDLIWNYLKRNMKLHCFMCFDLNFNARILETELIRLKNKNSKIKRRY